MVAARAARPVSGAAQLLAALCLLAAAEAESPWQRGTLAWEQQGRRGDGGPLTSLPSPRRRRQPSIPLRDISTPPTDQPDTRFRPLAAGEDCRRALLSTNFKPGDKSNPSFGRETLRPLRRWERLAQEAPWLLPGRTLTQPVLYSADETRSAVSGFRKCAVVGSAGVLKGSKWGRVLDDPRRYDAVIRLNNAPTRRFEADVGSRTTIRFIHDWHLSSKNLGEVKRTESGGVVMVWPSPTLPSGPDAAFGGPPPKENAKVSATLKKLRSARANVTMSRISDLMYHSSAIIGQRQNGKYPPYVPSSGWYCIFTALNLCSSLDVIGYSWESSQETLQRRRKATGDGRVKGTAYYFQKHANGLKDEDMYYRSRYERNPMSFHDLVKENASIRLLAKSCGFHMR